MAIKSFWLISVSNHHLLVSLATLSSQKYQVTSVGPLLPAPVDDPDQFLTAIDQSLSEAAATASISESQEPSHAAFILPYFWLSGDGKIEKTKQKIIERVCKKLKLNPLGFIAADEAMAESANQDDGFPASFVLLNLDDNTASLSLVYLGKIKDRILKNFSPPFSASILASMLSQLRHQSNLPPQIIIQGSHDPSLTEDISHFPWTSSTLASSFLHIPQVITYDQAKIISIYTSIVASQIQPQDIISDDEEKSDKLEPDPIVPDDSLQTVSASDLGFFSPTPDTDDISPSPSPSPSATKIPSIFPETPPDPPLFPDPPKIKKPAIKFSFSFFKKIPHRLFLLPLAFSPLLILIPFLFSSADLTIFVTPYDFKKDISVTLDSTADSVSAQNNIIPVKKNNFTVESSVSTITTGSREVGEKARGEIKIYNKQSVVQELDTDQILTDPQGRKFYLTNPVSVSAASSDLDEGVITLGQTKASVVAADIGPEYNIDQAVDLSFDDISGNLLVARTVSSFSGGSRSQIAAVSQEDKDLLKQKIDQAITDSVDQEVKKYDQVVLSSLQVNSGRLDYSRELGEAAQDITASVTSTATVFSLLPQQKQSIIKAFLSDVENFSQAQIDPDRFTLNFDIKTLQNDSALATLSIQGQALPSVDLPSLKKQLKGRRSSKLDEVLRQAVPRTYNYNLKTNFDFLKNLNPLPFNPDNFNITVKSELP